MAVYGSAANRKDLLDELIALSEHHVVNSAHYRNIVTSIFPNYRSASELGDLPYLPAKLFKKLTISSVSDSDVHRVMFSSGTSGETSKIVLDKDTARLQSVRLTGIMRHWLGNVRRPMLIIDNRDLLTGSMQSSARAAAVLGMMQMGKDYLWMLDEDGRVDFETLKAWLDSRMNQPLFVFGFTSQVWRALGVQLRDRELDLSRAVLFHGGGWKRLENRKVSREDFREGIRKSCGLTAIHDYYGMVEQLGSIWVEVDHHVYAPPVGASAVIRDPISLSVLPEGEVGLIQTFSNLPRSYPGHSILTDDLGSVVPINKDRHLFGDLGLKVVGRLPRAEARGCSDAVAIENV